MDSATAESAGNKGKGWSSPHKLKMSYQEKKDWETIEADIEALEEKIAGCEAEYLKYSSDFHKLNEITKEKEALEQELEEKMNRWEYLSELNDRINAQ